MKRCLALLVVILVANGAWASAGKCRKDDSLFHSEEGGCLDFRSGLVTSRKREKSGDWNAARAYCESLQKDKHAGFKDWRLPEERELVALTGDNGARAHLSFSVLSFFWTQSSDPEGAWAVSLADGDESFHKRDSENEILCLRKPADRDGDHVPDSSDQCSRTPAGKVVDTVGERKGCAPDDTTYRVPIAGVCEPLKEGECRRTRGCGWAPKVGLCIDVTTSECPRYPEEWWCRATAGCRWENEKCVYESN